MSIQDQLKLLEKEKARLAALEKTLTERARTQKEIEAKLEAFVKHSGLTPRDLVFALVDKFQVRLAGRRKGSGRTRRKRTKITVELRDAVKKAVKGGASMNATAKEFDISYAVVVKMVKGHYDKLK
ncbi:MAG: hypothetical protein ABSH19_02510 [Opitutales bacterium]|jgi:transposase-like protein